MKRSQIYTGHCITKAGQAVIEAFGNNKEAVIRQTLAGSLCFNENRFAIITSYEDKQTSIEHYTITSRKPLKYSLTGTVTN